jgi:dTDP-4-amino-4,6-dideoxygalactose transaminase
MSFNIVTEFENKIAKFYGSKYGIATDCCTHALELCLRYTKSNYINSPHRTYLSVPMLANKLNLELIWKDIDWKDYYYVTDSIIDAAVLWKENSYISNTFMCLSFQFQKHLSLGRGGMILTDNKEAAIALKKMSYDGRLPNILWREQNIDTMGYHYYMTPETADLGLVKLPMAKINKPKQWVVTDWPDLTKMDIFK